MSRSGSTLQYNICRNLVEQLDVGKGEGFFGGDQLITLQQTFWDWGKDDQFHVIKIHDFYPQAVEMSLNGSVKICYVYRDIRDVAASLKNKDKVNEEGLIATLDQAIEVYHKIKGVPNLLIQRYENVVFDVPKAIKEIVVFLGLKASEDVIKRVDKESSIQSAKKVMLSLAGSIQNTEIKTDQQFLYDSKTLLHHNHISNNSGASGVWRVDLEQEEINLITDRYKSWLMEVNYLLDINSYLNHRKQEGSGMRVEACCQRILSYALPLVDEKREGICIDVGVGTFAFYCEMFSMLGFKTIAVEPLPVEGVRVLCQYDGITLIEACLSDVTGTRTIHLGNVAAGLDSNYASLESDWFGVSTETREIQSLTLSKLLLNLNAPKVTCLKLDIEGTESTVITKFCELPKAWLPSIVMFEYGGGDSRDKGQYGWSPKYLNATMECIRALKECGYNFSIMIDNMIGTEARIFELQSCNLEPDAIFYPNCGYGNIIAFRDFSIAQDEIAKICAPYYEKSPSIDDSVVNKNVITLSATEELELYKFKFYQVRGELEQSQSQLHQTQGELEQSQSQLHQTQEVLEQYSEHLAQTEKILEQYQFQLQQIRIELQENQSLLYQQDWELERSRFQHHQTQAQLAGEKSQTDKIKADLYQAQAELEQLKAQLSLTQVELVRNRFQQQHMATEPRSENDVKYKLLVWDAWYAYQNSDLNKMQQCLQESLKFTSVSRTESLLKWLESFCQFSRENGHHFDTYVLTNSQEWKQLTQGRYTISQS